MRNETVRCCNCFNLHWSVILDGRYSPCFCLLYFQNVTSNRPRHTELSLPSIGCLCGNHWNQTVWKHQGFLSQDHWGDWQGGGFIPRSSCCVTARHLAPHKSVLDSNTSVVHIWINASLSQRHASFSLMSSLTSFFCTSASLMWSGHNQHQ